MTCFWDGIIQSLSLEDFRIITDFKKKPNPRQLVEFLKSKNEIYLAAIIKVEKIKYS